MLLSRAVVLSFSIIPSFNVQSLIGFLLNSVHMARHPRANDPAVKPASLFLCFISSAAHSYILHSKCICMGSSNRCSSYSVTMATRCWMPAIMKWWPRRSNKTVFPRLFQHHIISDYQWFKVCVCVCMSFWRFDDQLSWLSQSFIFY